MANRLVLLCLLLAVLSVHFCESKGGRGGGRSHSSHHSSRHGSSSGGTSWGWGSSKSKSSSSSSSYSGGHSYPSSSSGLSGYGKQTSHGYPYSSSGMSGSNGYSSSSGSNTHSYPSSGTRLSGSGSSHSYNTYNSHYSPGYGSGHSSYIHPTYYSAPQHVYVTEYRNSDSRYSDLLTGLTLYNMGRSHSHYHNHYYHDDYYARRYNSHGSSSSSSSSYDTPDEHAKCRLKIKDHNSIETLKVPCEVVSTFTKSDENSTTQETRNTTVCTTETTILQNNASQTAGTNNTLLLTNTTSAANGDFSTENDTGIINLENDKPSTNTSAPTNVVSDPLLVQPMTPINANVTETKVNTSLNSTNVTYVNVTKCTTKADTDPLTVKGPAVNPSGLECTVEIETKYKLVQNKVDCDTLVKYAKMPEPKKGSGILPPRSKLKSWFQSPPWWMSMFIAV